MGGRPFDGDNFYTSFIVRTFNIYHPYNKVKRVFKKFQGSVRQRTTPAKATPRLQSCVLKQRTPGAPSSSQPPYRSLSRREKTKTPRASRPRANGSCPRYHLNVPASRDAHCLDNGRTRRALLCFGREAPGPPSPAPPRGLAPAGRSLRRKKRVLLPFQAFTGA